MESWRENEVKARSGIRPPNGASFDAPRLAGAGFLRLGGSMSVVRKRRPVKRVMAEKTDGSLSRERLETKMELQRR